MVANRGEIAIRVFRACTELDIRTVAVYSKEDELSLHRYKADEAYEIGQGKGAVEAYLDMDGIVDLAVRLGVDAIHPGYGFLAENAEFARRCRSAGIAFIGPTPEQLELFGDKVASRRLAEAAGLPVVPATDGPVPDVEAARAFARRVGYPVMIKAVAGGGGRGMRKVHDDAELERAFERARSEAQAAFGDASVYIEKAVERPKHIEVQLLADGHGSVVHLFERDCSVQRRHQKIVELAPAPALSEATRQAMGQAAVRLMQHVGYQGAATVEFLLDADENFYFLEVNPRIQVEHTVTELITGVDLVQAQILIAQGRRLADPPISLPDQSAVTRSGVAVQCRITTEDPGNGFVPDHGRISAYRTATGFGVRVDDGAGYHGAYVSPHYDSLLAKVCTWDRTFEGAARKMLRALREFRIRGVKTNIPFLQNVVVHPVFLAGAADTGFVESNPDLYQLPEMRDRGTRLLSYVGWATVNHGPGVGRGAKPELGPAPLPDLSDVPEPAAGTRRLLEERGPEGVAAWMLERQRLLLTDTTFRDAHQSLLATRVRTKDLVRIAAATARLMPGLFSAEVWGGATFDVAYRFLKEDPWERLDLLRREMPSVLLQMLVRGANAVGYRNYPDNVVRAFVREAARSGIDVFRIFDSLNWVEAMTVAMETAAAEGKLVEAAICYTGDIEDPARTKYSLEYYVRLARELKRRGAHILGIKDMAGLLKPFAARTLVKALKEETGMPVHLHTHDAAGVGTATVLAAAEAGVDAVDGAIAALAGGTSQPALNGIVAALQHHPRSTGMDLAALQRLDDYWSVVRTYYAAFETKQDPVSAEVYLTEIPGGQYTNLWQQAQALGLADRWGDVKRMYAVANRILGDIVKVTPSSKAVGDLALLMVQYGVGTEAELLAKADELTFPDSVVDYFSGMMGQPEGGFPKELQAKVLKGRKPVTVRPGLLLPPADWAELARELAEAVGEDGGAGPAAGGEPGSAAKSRVPAGGSAGEEEAPPARELISYALYPQVYKEFVEHRRAYSDTWLLDTPVFFYGLRPGQQTAVEIEPGKTLIIKLLGIGEARPDGTRSVWFELNGQHREVTVRDEAVESRVVTRPKAEKNNPAHIGAPMPGRMLKIDARAGQTVKRNETLGVIEAMKMEIAVMAGGPARIREVLVEPGTSVEAGDLLFVIEPLEG